MPELSSHKLQTNEPKAPSSTSIARRRFGLRTVDLRGLRRTAQRAGPHRSFPVFEQRCHKLFAKLRVPGQLAAIPADKAGKRANPKSAVARDEQTVRGGEMLTRRWLPGDA